MKIDLPRGQWAELCDLEDITRPQKRAYQRRADEMMFGKDGAQVSYEIDPDNPAVMIPAKQNRARLTAENMQELQDMVFAACIRSWSYDIPVSPEGLDTLSAMAADMIEEALNDHGHYDVFNGTGPKETKGTDSTSSSTSAGEEPDPPQE